MEEAPRFALLGVVAVVQVALETHDSIGRWELSVTGMKDGGAAVGLLVELVNNYVSDRHY